MATLINLAIMHGNNSKRGLSNTLSLSIYVVLLEQEVFQQVLID